MISQIGSIAISLAGGLIFSSFIFLGLYNKSKNNDYLEVAERAILARGKFFAFETNGTVLLALGLTSIT